MANITAVLKAASGNSQRGRNVYYMDNVIDLTANSINPNGDTIQAITVPANTLIVAAGLQVVESATQNTGTDATASLGFTGGDVDEFVATFDIDLYPRNYLVIDCCIISCIPSSKLRGS